MAQPAQQLVQTQGGVQTSDLPQAPTEIPQLTPAGAAAAGATPQQAAMTGSSAQKSAALTKVLKPEESLAEQSRLTPTAPQATPADQAAQQKAQRLQQLGSLGTRVQSLIEGHLQSLQSQTTSLGINEDYLNQLYPGQPDKVAAAKAALQSYTQGGMTEEGLKSVSQAVGLQNLAGGGINKLYTGPEESLKALTASVGKTPPTVGQLDLGKIGVDPAQLAQDLGTTPDALAAMTPTQLQQAVTNVQHREYGNVAALKAEYAGAEPLRRQQILQQIQAADQTGQAASELAAADLADKVAKGEEVKFAGQTQNIEALLKSDEISKTILNAASSPAALEELKKTEPGLAEWVSKNVDAVKAMQAGMQGKVTGFQDVQGELSKVKSEFDPKVLAAAVPGGIPETATSGELAKLKSQLDANPVLKAARESPEIKALITAQPAMMDSLQAAPEALGLAAKDSGFAALIKADPSQLKWMQGKTEAQLKTAMASAAELSKDPDGLLAKLSNGDVTAGFTQDPVSAANVMKWQGVLKSMPAGVRGDPDFVNLVKSGTLTDMDDIAAVGATPGMLRAIVDHQKTVKDNAGFLNNPNPSPKDAFKTLFGDAPPEQVFKTIERANYITKHTGDYDPAAVMQANTFLKSGIMDVLPHDPQGNLPWWSDEEGKNFTRAWDKDPKVASALIDRVKSALGAGLTAHTMIQGGSAKPDMATSVKNYLSSTPLTLGDNAFGAASVKAARDAAQKSSDDAAARAKEAQDAQDAFNRQLAATLKAQQAKTLSTGPVVPENKLATKMMFGRTKVGGMGHGLS